MKFTKIPEATFQNLQLNAGVLLSSFSPASASVVDSNILGATTGGITFAATPTFQDFGEDIDNCPKNTMELKKLTEWETKLSGTFVSVNSALGKKLVAAADNSGGEAQYALTSDTALVSGKVYYTRSGAGTEQSPYTYSAVAEPSASSLSSYYEVTGYDPTKITPRNDLALTDFADLWLVGDYSDKNGDTNGGFIAVHMLNALSTGGFQIKSTDKAKGQFAFEFTGHYSINSQDTVPFEVYIKPGSAEPTT